MIDLYIELNRQNLGTDCDFEFSKFFIKDNKLPQKLNFHRHNVWCVGYQAIYNQKFNLDKIISEIKASNWQYFNTLIGPLIITYLDVDSRRVHIVTDQLGSLFVYYYFDNSKIIIATDPNNIAKSVKAEINWEKSLRMLTNFELCDTKTIFQNVFEAPTTSVTTFTLNKKISISVQKYGNILHQKISGIPDSQVKFLDVYLKLLTQVVEEQAKLMPEEQVYAQLSSGLDSSLINYILKNRLKLHFTSIAYVAPKIKQMDSKSIIFNFARKHKLNLKIYDVTEDYPFSTKKEFAEFEKFPFLSDNINTELNFLKHLNKQKIKFVFTGFYGDELYYYHQFHRLNKYYHALRFFEFQYLKHQKIFDLFFTPQAIDVLLDRNYFSQTSFFTALISDNQIGSNRTAYMFNKNKNKWEFSPYCDPRLLLLMNEFLTKNPQKYSKKTLLQPLVNKVYLPEQFSNPKSTFTYLYSQSLQKKHNSKILDILDLSYLTKIGYIKGREIAQNLRKNKIKKYQPYRLMLSNIIKFEYWLQKRGGEVNYD